MWSEGILSGKVAVVTGALGRLGPIWCETLLSAGSRVIACDLPGVEIRERFSRLTEEFPQALHLRRLDVLNREEVMGLVEMGESELGPISILINNAAIDAPPGVRKTYSLEEFPRIDFLTSLKVNVFGAFQLMQIVGAAMQKHRAGSIVNIGSLYGSVSPDPRLYDHIPCDPPFLKPPVYGASKAALINLTRYFAAHWGPSGIRVNSLSPGGVAGDQDEFFKKKFSERVPLGRMAAEEDLKGPLLFLSSDASSYVTGIDLKVDGGFTTW